MTLASENENKSLKVVKINPRKYTKARVNKQIEYTKELKFPLEMHGGRGQVQQHDQDKERGPGLAGYVMWKSDTKSVA